VPVRQALGRYLAGPVYAARSVPAYHGAAMDGLAVRASSTFSALPESPVLLSASAEARLVNTGAPLPEGADAVVMIENTEAVGDGLQPLEHFDVGQLLRRVAAAGGEPEIVRDREQREIARAGHRVAGLQDVVEREADGVRARWGGRNRGRAGRESDGRGRESSPACNRIAWPLRRTGRPRRRRPAAPRIGGGWSWTAPRRGEPVLGDLWNYRPWCHGVILTRLSLLIR